MLETQITMEPPVAHELYLSYRVLKAEQRTAEDAEIQRSYLELSRGHAIINATKALATAGIGEDGLPRIAFCKASARWCHVHMMRNEVVFIADQSYWSSRERKPFRLPCPGADPHLVGRDARTVVPPIPPAHRPAGSLDRYWLMWEVGEGGWEDVPSDPALLRRLNATTFAVLAVWDLTEVEQMVLRGRE